MVAVHIHSNRMTFSAIMPLVTFISHKAMQCTTGSFPLLIYGHSPSFSLDVLFPLSSYTPEKLFSEQSTFFKTTAHAIVLKEVEQQFREALW